MKKYVLLSLFALALIVGFASPASARVDVGIGIGGPCCYYHHGYGGGYWGDPYYYPPYYAAPPVVYAPPTVYYSAPPVVTYAPAPATTIITQAPAPAAAPPAATEAVTSPVVDSDAMIGKTYTDSQGRTCHHYQVGETKGKACLADDNNWHVTP